MPKPFISVVEAVEQTGIRKRTLQHAIAKGWLPAHKMPGLTGAYLIDPADLDDYLTRREQASA